ncbi:MAG: hypothetical protein AVDCRST_MAG15-1488, partial [uncultured Rubellimicrobium sp.]
GPVRHLPHPPPGLPDGSLDAHPPRRAG